MDKITNLFTTLVTQLQIPVGAVCAFVLVIAGFMILLPGSRMTEQGKVVAICAAIGLAIVLGATTIAAVMQQNVAF